MSSRAASEMGKLSRSKMSSRERREAATFAALSRYAQTGRPLPKEAWERLSPRWKSVLKSRFPKLEIAA